MKDKPPPANDRFQTKLILNILEMQQGLKKELIPVALLAGGNS